MKGGKDEIHKCPLCGNEFYKGESTACNVCPLGPKCKLIKCPNCGYEFIPGVDER
ncbi:MAG: hypothetical protein ACQESD_02240 [Thermoplasmatota archaeon]